MKNVYWFFKCRHVPSLNLYRGYNDGRRYFKKSDDNISTPHSLSLSFLSSFSFPFSLFTSAFISFLRFSFQLSFPFFSFFFCLSLSLPSFSFFSVFSFLFLISFFSFLFLSFPSFTFFPFFYFVYQ